MNRLDEKEKWIQDTYPIVLVAIAVLLERVWWRDDGDVDEGRGMKDVYKWLKTSMNGWTVR